MSISCIKKLIATAAVSIGALGALGVTTAYADSPAMTIENDSTIYDLSATTEGENSVKLIWYDSYYFYNDGYLVEQQTSSGWVLINDITSTSYSNEYEVTGLSSGTQYTFRISSYFLDDNGEKVISLPSTVNSCTSAQAVQNLKISRRSENSLTIQWDKIDNADGYIIYLAEFENEYPMSIDRLTNNSSVTYMLKDLQAGTEYYIYVQSYKIFENKEVYGDMTNIVGTTNPSATTGLALYERGSNYLCVEWDYNYTADGYIIYKKSGNEWVRKAKITNPNKNYCKVTGLSGGTAYTIRVQPYLMADEKALYGDSQTVTARTNPAAVKNLKLKSRTASSITISWDKNTSADGYIIYKYDSWDGWTRVKKITKNSTTEYKLTKLDASTQYSIRVVAYKMSGKKALYADEKTISVYTYPNAISGLKLAERHSNSIKLSWNYEWTADGYIIYKKVNNDWVRVKKITHNYNSEYTVKGLSPSKAYDFKIQTYHMVGKNALYGDSKTITVQTNPAAVKNLKLKTRASTSLTVSWDKNTSADGYIVFKNSWDGWTRVKKITKNSTTEYKLTKLDASTQYSIRVVAYKMSGNKALYADAKTISVYTSPKAISGLKLAERRSNSLKLSWNCEWTADGYIIYKKVNKDWVRVKKLTDSGIDEYTVKGLSPATGYELKVQTYKMVGKKALYGNTKTIKVYTSAEDIKNLTAKALSTTSAKLSWSASKSAKGYYIEEMVDYDKWKKVGDTKNTTMTFNNIPKYGDKIYRVRAYFTAENKRIYTSDAQVYVSTYIRYDPTQAEIKAKFKKLLSGIEFKTAYKSMYLDKAPYRAGSLTDKTLKDALNMVNFCRYIAGLPDDVELDSVYNEYCQAGALLLQVSNFAHYPDKPSDMSDDLYYKGATGTSNSNIAWGFNSLPHSILSYMDDSYPSNIDTVGHRLWILSPYMKYTGFGAVDNKYTMLSLDSSRNCGRFASDYFTWPPKNMPYEIYTMYDDQVFGDNAYAFSVSLNSSYDSIDQSKLTVDISSQKLGKKWHLDQSCNKIEKYLHVSAGRGMAQCIIFNVGTFPNNDKVTVTVNGLTKNGKSSPITYTVNFFSAS